MKESKGALVAEPMADSPAAKVGIQSRDVITAVNGNPVKDARDFAMQIGGMAPGAAVNVTIWREGAEKSISLTLGEMPKERAAAVPQPAATGTDVPKLGLMLAAAEHATGKGSEGVVVVDIDLAGSPPRTASRPATSSSMSVGRRSPTRSTCAMPSRMPI